MSGDGGDELFGGYTRYASTARLWNGMSRVPVVARDLLAGACHAWARAARGSPAGARAGRLALYLRARDAQQCYAVKVTQWNDAEALVHGAGGKAGAAPLPAADFISTMMLDDALGYLPDDILAKVDRAAMAVSLETRVPLLDPAVVEFAWSLPLHMKVRDGRSKWLLRRVLSRYVPDSLMERPKMGFGVPVGEWLRGPLRGWAEELLSEARLRGEGFLDPARVRERWRRHLAGIEDATDSLWIVLMFQAWLESVSTARRADAA
jgi:asparagine synthase (glutamine-hydrolysing)